MALSEAMARLSRSWKVFSGVQDGMSSRWFGAGSGIHFSRRISLDCCNSEWMKRLMASTRTIKADQERTLASIFLENILSF